MIQICTVKRKKVIQAGIGILLFMIAIICCLYFGEKQIQRMMQKILCAKVIKYEEELLEIAKECPSEEALYCFESNEDNGDEYFKTIYYKDLKDENVDRVFRTFLLRKIDKRDDDSVEFAVRPTVIYALWGDYRQGFYYTENDEPVDVVYGSEVKETEFETTIVGLWTYWYRTEKITDNFWYYETKIEWYYSTKR